MIDTIVRIFGILFSLSIAFITGLNYDLLKEHIYFVCFALLMAAVLNIVLLLSEKRKL